MNFPKGSIYSGFIVEKNEYIAELESEAVLLKHQKSGARLLYLGNKDDNKVFSIAFRTPPYNDNGVAHILEHSVLCGSRKYPLKEPFVELVKGSLNTFLNAMTYPDKTVYPVASRNQRDFFNLMDVYLDAVFFPLIYKNQYTLLQEGWHYSLTDPQEPLKINGVVYNEMKGVFSSADALLEYEAMKALFPDTPYGFESGGHPDNIIELTQEEFLDFHRTHYTPENAYLYLYGDLDLQETLAYLDGEYLSKFTAAGLDSSAIAYQQPLLRTKEVEALYPVAPEEELTGKTYYELSIVTGKALDAETSSVLAFLTTLLTGMESSPLKKALLENKIGTDISASYSGSLLQPVFSLRVGGSEPELRDKFLHATYKTLQQLSINGLDGELTEAAFHAVEFRLREADFGIYPKGLIYALSCLNTWLYGGDPLENLRYEKMLSYLRSAIDTGRLQQLIEAVLLDNTHKVLLTLKPAPGKEEEDNRLSAERLAAQKGDFSAEQIKVICEKTAELKRRQGAEDSPEALNTIPLLKREDIVSAPERLESEVHAKEGITHLYLPSATGKIAYLNWYFDISGIEPQLLPYLFLLTDLLGKIGAGQYDYQRLSNALNRYTGGVEFSAAACSEKDDTEKYSIVFSVKVKALLGDLPQLGELLRAVALETDFSEIGHIEELVRELKTDWDAQMFSRGQTVATARLASYFAASGRVNEQHYLSYYFFLKRLTEDFEALWPEACSKMLAVRGKCFNSSKVLFGYAAERTARDSVENFGDSFVQSLPEAEEAGRKPVMLPVPDINEGIMTSGKVQYVTCGGNFQKAGYAYCGAMKVVETMLRYDYLWTKVRVQGGAYGASAKFERNGGFYLSSYRDPHLTETLAIYAQLPDYLASFEAAARELDKYVIGTISIADTPLTNAMKLERVCHRYLKGITYDDVLRERREILEVTNSDIRGLAPLAAACIGQHYFCVLGNAEALETERGQFAKLIKI